MPRTKKPAGTAVDRRNGRRAEVAGVRTVLVPDIDRAAFLPASLEQWDAYWADPVAASQTPADLMMVRTWIEAYDDYRRKRAMADKEPLVLGSQGQQVANPMYQIANQALAFALQCAKQLGIGAKNRADLGMAIGAEAQTLAAVNDRYRSTAVRRDDDDDDPRLIQDTPG